jgi:hypothetical protein
LARFSLLASRFLQGAPPYAAAVRVHCNCAIALTASGVETEELTEQVEQVESSVAALRQREYDVLKKHVLLRNIELPKGANAFMRELAGQLIANCASLLHTKIKDKGTISGYFRSCNPRIQPRFHRSSAAGAWRFSGHDLRRLQDATRRHREDPAVLRKGGTIPITQR